MLVHGYKGYALRDFSAVYKFYYDQGFNVLLIDQRSHGESEGKFITFGVKERYDLKDWINFLNEKIGSSKLPIVLDGVSMGCATILMSLGLKLPENVKCAVADCGYTSPYAIVKKVFTQISGLPVHPFMEIAMIMIKLHARFSLKEVSTVDAMKSNSIPVFFAHGLADDFVPSEMTLENYNACVAPKHLLLVENAEHGLSYMVDQERYKKELLEFFDKYLFN